jgi:hypothetical protein
MTIKKYRYLFIDEVLKIKEQIAEKLVDDAENEELLQELHLIKNELRWRKGKELK